MTKARDKPVTEPTEPTRQAVRECAKWLATCRHLGWRHDELDFLEALWWAHHDNRGNIVNRRRVQRTRSTNDPSRGDHA